ncbi:uncharacterized protein METZ01_LOCUS85911, partial [marine metagenome]
VQQLGALAWRHIAPAGLERGLARLDRLANFTRRRSADFGERLLGRRVGDVQAVAGTVKPLAID